ncbi:MAG: hypothetical protein AB1716_01590 [Planctomycetota bacterium]
MDFGNLPLVEAALRAAFAKPIRMTYALVNSVHERLLPDFREVAEPERFEARPGAKNAFELGPGQLPGAVFGGSATGVALSLQNHVLVSRWLRQLGAQTPAYPRFPALRDALLLGIAALGAGLPDGQSPAVAVVNMSYVNFIRAPHAVPILSRYFSDKLHVAAARDAKALHKLEVAWREQADTDLRVDLAQVGARVGDQTVEGFQLTTVAGLRLNPGTSLEAALDQVHARLQTFFRDLLSDSAKVEWQLQVVSDG